MTLEELDNAIKLLNGNFKGKTLKPENLPIKEFVIGPKYSGLIPQFQIAYIQFLGDAKSALKMLKLKADELTLYAMFSTGRYEDYPVGEFILRHADEVLSANGFKLDLLVGSTKDKN